MASIVTKDLKDRVKGNTFALVRFTYQDNLGAAIDITGATIETEFRFRCKTGAVVKTITTASGITIENATSGIFVFDAFTPVTWEVDSYYYDVKVTFADGTIETYVQGIVKILQNITD